MNEVERGGGVGGNAGDSQGFPQGFSQLGQSGGQFGQNMPQRMNFSQGTVSSGEGDIVLDNSGSGKTRKGLVVVLIVLILLIAGVCVGFMVQQGTRVSHEGEDSDMYDDGVEILDLKFNKFINYMVDGEESESSVDGISSTTDYYIDENYEDFEYLNQLSVFYDDFWNNISETERQRLNGIPVSRIREYLDFLLGKLSADSSKFDGSTDKALRLIKRASQGAIEALRGSVSEVTE